MRRKKSFNINKEQTIYRITIETRNDLSYKKKIIEVHTCKPLKTPLYCF